MALAQTPAAPAAPAAAKKAAPAAKTSPAATTPKPATTGAKPATAGAKPATPGAKPVVAAKPAAPKPATLAPVTLKTDEEKTIYALGLSISRSLAQFELSADEVEIVKQALSDAAAKKPAVEISEWGPKLQGLAEGRMQRAAEREKAASAAFLAKAATEPGAVKTESGLIYQMLTAGSGASPKASDTVKVHYRGTLTNGTEFDSSYKRGEPAEFGLSQVVPCWTEGVQKMKVGEKAKLVCPSTLAYGERGQGPIPGGAALIFEIELLEIKGAK